MWGERSEIILAFVFTLCVCECVCVRVNVCIETVIKGRRCGKEGLSCVHRD